MNNTECIKIAVASDLHCLHKGETTASGISFLYSNAPKMPVAHHPVYALLELMKNDSAINADVLICPGDIADKADEQGLVSGWEYLKKIQQGLGARHLFSTIGNHDVDSRRTHSAYTSAFQLLETLDDDYPNKEKKDFFWSKKFALIELEDFQVLILNTCHNHSSKADANQSIISPETIPLIEEELKKVSKSKYRFAFCHHHPIKHSNTDIQYKDGDVIDNGDKLVALLDKYDFQIIVHGHKHDPRLKRDNSLTIFAAGSFSSLMNIRELGADNCFHIIELYPFKKQGIIKSWIYAPTRGWEIKSDREFPCMTGFGNEVPVEKLAKECHAFFEEKNEKSIIYSALKARCPDIQFLIPDDQKRLSQILKTDYGLTLVPELPNIPKILTALLYD
jgi:predicted phosphodiesterase